MKKVFLLRHAKSSWKYPGLSDFDRPLNSRGSKDAPDMALRFYKSGFSIDGIITSSAVRALAIAEIFAETLSIEKNNYFQDKRLYHAFPHEITAVIAHTPAHLDHVVVVGHNPGLTDFINLKTDDFLDNLPTSGIYGITFDINHWAQIEKVKGEKCYYNYPKLEN